MMGWEYTSASASTINLGGFVEALNELGAQGWELVGFASADKTLGLNSLMAILRRPRELLTPAGLGTPEGWLPDPSGRHPDRHWDGRQWTKWVRDMEGGTRSEDAPYADALLPPPQD